MVAFHRPSSQPPARGRPAVGRGTPQRRRSASEGGPRLYLAVDNTRAESIPSSSVAPVLSGGGSVAVLPEGRLLSQMEASFRHWMQSTRNEVRRSGLSGRLVGQGPAVLMALALVFGGLLAVRLVQGSPPSELAGQVADSAITSAAAPRTPTLDAGDRLITVQAGDSLWSIATDRFPDRDPRDVVDTLAAANGTSVIEAGQQIIVPATLIGSGTLLD